MYDTTVAASTCIKINGFYDEVTCALTTSIFNGATLIVKNGFDSNYFSGSTNFAFNISEIRNPKTSEETPDFKVEIFDATGNL